jgi:hypothetical protein
MSELRMCTVCLNHYSLSFFRARQCTFDGVDKYCISCRKEYNNIYCNKARAMKRAIRKTKPYTYTIRPHNYRSITLPEKTTHLPDWTPPSFDVSFS